MGANYIFQKLKSHPTKITISDGTKTCKGTKGTSSIISLVEIHKRSQADVVSPLVFKARMVVTTVRGYGGKAYSQRPKEK